MNLVAEEPKFKVMKSYEDKEKKKTFIFTYTAKAKDNTEVKRRVGRPRKDDY
jgi:hypothetical protein